MNYRALTWIVLLIFLIVALFGLTSLLSHSDHHAHCPLQGAATVMCESTTVEHIGIWQEMFVATLLLIAFAISIFGPGRQIAPFATTERALLRRMHVPLPRPTLFQELFSAGILNRKELYVHLSISY